MSCLRCLKESLVRCVRAYLSLLTFLTTIPVGVHDIEAAARGFPAIPLVGVVVGYAAAAASLPGGWLGLALSALAMYALSGFLHLDGLIDYGDVIGSGARGAGAEAVLKDPRVGGKGVALAAILIATVYGGLADAFTSGWAVPAILSSCIAAYESMFLTASLGRPAPYGGMGSMFIRLGGRRWVTNAACLAASAALSIPVAGLLPLATALMTSFAVATVTARDAMNRLGFVNGDVIGFSAEVARAASLIAVAGCARLCPPTPPW